MLKYIQMTSMVIVLTMLSCNAHCAIDQHNLQQQRIDSIKYYVRLLGKGDYKEIPTLFTKHAVAVSSSGESDSIDHFYQALFMKTISSPQSRLINIFDGQLKSNMMTAYYNLSWVGSDGTVISQKFVDLIVFQADSTKIKTIYVFSNNFHENVFSQTSDA